MISPRVGGSNLSGVRFWILSLRARCGENAFLMIAFGLVPNKDSAENYALITYGSRRLWRLNAYSRKPIAL